ncbi:plasma-membrane calcium-translocating P-type ATPase [Gracilibacillus orientalis]|uniref:P-type Ca(2+) transporter n=1 Tax=Gracilibacillus orientalis TaxID=334253 RepID=A0A1I4HN49_9BACI|nr:cation-translocating P-type ATPase [Gracilibacillus orientalis]SFL43190.1 plasma-membrane calcium-translocating P-type ATPase [Gracilibacillus orientalis]
MSSYQKTKQEVLDKWEVTKLEGLAGNEANNRLEQEGYNEIADKEKVPTWKLFMDTFKDAMVVVLLVAAIVQLVLGELIESIIIFIVILLNSIISVVQTKKAESSLDALRDMSAPEAKVIRDGTSQTIMARELVPGDIVLLEAGDYIPADGRLLDAESLKINEGMLTGESDAVEKVTDPIQEEVSIGDQLNMVFSSSLVVNGRGTFVVTATGEKAEIGKIAEMIETAEAKQTPLQRKLDSFSKKLGIAILLICMVIFAVQVGRIWLGDADVDMTKAVLDALMFSVAIAVAAIPEALQSIVTIVLSVGTNKMAKQHAIIRRLPAVETLGSTSVICTDKTGTLTQNQMTVTEAYLPEVEDPFSNEKWTKAERLLIQTAALCNDSYINEDNKEIGDPTEIALIRLADKQKQPYKELRNKYKREAELPFDSERKMMSTVYTIGDERLMLIKGGPDVMVDRASTILVNGEEQELTSDWLNILDNQNESYSKQALRVLAFAYKKMEPDHQVTLDDERDFTLIGFTAMMDPPRDAVYGSIEESKKAGIKPVMITGDHKTTAEAIGKEIGLMAEDDMAVTGKELDDMSDQELDKKLARISVYARVSPENKIRIVKAWQRKNQVTAMTGDGVNDAPALKQADIGIGMGSGTDVAKDSAAMILTDDNFVSIVKAVSVGRTVFDNIKKSIAYLFAGNLGAIIAILFAVIMNWANPFTALQLLFINLVNDSLPAIALGMEKSEPNVMKRKPRKIDEGIFAGGTLRSVIIRGLLIGVAVIVSHYIGLQHSEGMGVAMAFTTLILSRTLQTFPARSNVQTAFGAGFFQNKYVLGAVVIGFVLYSIIIMPFARAVFRIPDEFGWNQGLIAFSLALMSVVLMEVLKVLRTKKE